MKNDNGVSLRGWRVLRRQLVRWWQLHEQRRQLAALDDAALKDLGLSRADVFAESERPFWDDPLGSPPRQKKASGGFDERCQALHGG
ncbi:hypothetical protein DN826_01515 [Stutzerimonas nosocomialis]|uniref:YjiS-like domain-containing protein n=1 Tax=Stutzerimonas nosocomialis TaxID=1056496 RepID=A0A5R9QD38_9GAMM|nr:hypothetical protein DN826_01515 [Stutzerimonas nosocomialis]TLX63046.1 hypothetical protein DN820_13595 [Stutzerimonas nosocomialis]